MGGSGRPGDESWAVFERDAKALSGYGYTIGAQLSSRLATARNRDALLAAGRFEGRRVIDIGCGDGMYSVEFWDLGRPAAWTGVDAAPSAIEVAEKRRGERPIRFATGDCYHLDFADDAFDVSLLNGVLHHLDDPAPALREALRVAPEVVILDPNGRNPGLKVIERVSKYHREHAERSFSARQLQRWIRAAGGRVLSLEFAGFVPMFSPDRVARSMKLIEPLVERLPGVRAVGCAMTVIVARRST